MSPNTRFILALLTVLSAGILSGGCGGAGVDPIAHSMGRGRLSVSVKWPKASSRVIPTASKSMRIELWANGAKATEKLLVAPATTAVFDEYPIGTVEARVTAYSEADGTGPPVATGTGTGTFLEGADGSIPVTLASTIVRIEGYPSAHYGFTGETSTFDVYGEDVDGNTVAQDPADTTAVSADPAIATVDQMGIVSFNGEGETTITLTDRNSGQTTELFVFVVTPEP